MLLYVMPSERSTKRSLYVHDVQYILAITPDRPRRPGGLSRLAYGGRLKPPLSLVRSRH